jgi:hypothetical protein
LPGVRQPTATIDLARGVHAAADRAVGHDVAQANESQVMRVAPLSFRRRPTAAVDAADLPT